MNRKTIYYFLLVIILAVVCGTGVSIFVSQAQGASTPSTYSNTSVIVRVIPDFTVSGSNPPVSPPIFYPSPTPTNTPVTTSNLQVSMLGDITGGAVDDVSGQTQESIDSSTKDGTISLEVADGTIAKRADGTRLDLITVVPVRTPHPLPEKTGVIGIPMNFGPDGSTFNPPLTITLHYTNADIPKGSTEDDLFIAVWVSDHWLKLDSTQDKNRKTLTASVPHFTDYALLANLHPVSDSANSASGIMSSPQASITAAPSTTATKSSPVNIPMPELTSTPQTEATRAVTSTSLSSTNGPIATFNWALLAGVALAVICLSIIIILLPIIRKRTSLVFLENAESPLVGVPYRMTIQVRNGAGRVFEVDRPINIKLTTTSATGRFDVDSNGPFNGSLTSIIIPQGASSVSFHYLDIEKGRKEIQVHESSGKGWEKGKIKIHLV